MKKINLKLTSATSNDWKLHGALTMMSLSASWRSLDKARPDRSPWKINFAEITQMDSAGVAFLLDCIRYADANTLELSFMNLSHEVIELIEAQGVMSLIQPYIKGQNDLG